MAETRTLPSIVFTTKYLRPHEQFDAWRENMMQTFEAFPTDQRTAQTGFKLSGNAYALGELVIGQATYDGHRTVRDSRKIARDGIDHFHVHLCTAGGAVNSLDGRDVILQPGNIQIHNLGRRCNLVQKASSAIGVIMTREMLCAALPKSVEPHGLVLRGNSALGALLSSYLKSLIQQLDHVSVGDGPVLANATAHMIAACFHQTTETRAQAQTAIDLSMLDQHKQFVAKNLHDPALGPDVLCAMSGLSRTKLYRLFEFGRRRRQLHPRTASDQNIPGIAESRISPSPRF